MVSVLFFAAGAVIVATTVYDFLKTAIGMAGLGPITRRVSAGLWICARRYIPLLRASTGWRLEDAVGPGILTIVALVWISLSTLGYTLMFAVEGALIASSPEAELETQQRIAFAGSSLSTLGGSLVNPGGPFWDALSMIAALNGMIVLTLSVSFVQGVIKVTSDGRSMALQVTALLLKKKEMSREAVLEELSGLADPITLLVMELRSTPMVGYFSTRRSQINFPSALISLVDLIEEADRPPRPAQQVAKLAQLRLALRELGELDSHRRPYEQLAGLSLARRWAEKRIIPAHEDTTEDIHVKTPAKTQSPDSQVTRPG